MCYCTLYQHSIALLLLLLLVLLQQLLLLHVQLLMLLHLLMLMLHGRRVDAGFGPVRVGLRTGRAPRGVGAGGQEVAPVDLLPAVVRRRRVHKLLAELCLLLLLLLLLLREVEPLLVLLRGNRGASHRGQVRRARGQLRGRASRLWSLLLVLRARRLDRRRPHYRPRRARR